MKRPWIAWGLAAAVVAVGVAVGAVSLRGPLVDAVVVQSAPLVRTLQFSARVATLSRVDVGSTLTGRVAQVRVAEGAQVRQGDVLVQLESDELRAALAQAVASERQAQARLTGLRSSGRTAAQAASAQANATLQAAIASLARVQQLVADGFYSPAQLDEARRAVDVARAQQLSAQAQMQANADAGSDVVQAQAQWALAQAATVAARARLAQTDLLAPADARVLVREVEPGQIVQPGKALLSLALAGPTQLVAQVDERFLDQLQPGQKATVVADAFAGQRFTARVLSIAPSVDAQRGAIEVKFALEQQAPGFLREDMTLSVEVETARRESALVLPLAALRGAVAGDAGTVLVREVEPGQIVQPGKALFSLALAGPTQLVAQVDERFLEQLQLGQPAWVVADAFAGQRFAARVLSIAPAVDAQRGAIEVKFSIEQTPAFLREDMTLSVEVETARRERALVLPQAALRGDLAGDMGTVLLLQDGRAQARAVRLGLRTLDAVEVLEGLQERDTVLRGGAVQAGDRVRARTVAWTAGAGAHGASATGGGDAGSALTNAMGR